LWLLREMAKNFPPFSPPHFGSSPLDAGLFRIKALYAKPPPPLFWAPPSYVPVFRSPRPRFPARRSPHERILPPGVWSLRTGLPLTPFLFLPLPQTFFSCCRSLRRVIFSPPSFSSRVPFIRDWAAGNCRPPPGRLTFPPHILAFFSPHVLFNPWAIISLTRYPLRSSGLDLLFFFQDRLEMPPPRPFLSPSSPMRGQAVFSFFRGKYLFPACGPSTHDHRSALNTQSG